MFKFSLAYRHVNRSIRTKWCAIQKLHCQSNWGFLMHKKTYYVFEISNYEYSNTLVYLKIYVLNWFLKKICVKLNYLKKCHKCISLFSTCWLVNIDLHPGFFSCWILKKWTKVNTVKKTQKGESESRSVYFNITTKDTYFFRYVLCTCALCMDDRLREITW